MSPSPSLLFLILYAFSLCMYISSSYLHPHCNLEVVEWRWGRWWCCCGSGLTQFCFCSGGDDGSSSITFSSPSPVGSALYLRLGIQENVVTYPTKLSSRPLLPHRLPFAASISTPACRGQGQAGVPHLLSHSTPLLTLPGLVGVGVGTPHHLCSPWNDSGGQWAGTT